MNTPVFDFVKSYNKSKISRFHMPAHKGKRLLGPENIDITEISGADILYNCNGILKESQKNASNIFGTAATYYSTEGSTLCIKAMLAVLAESVKGHKPNILASRNVHKSFIYACALLDINVTWIFGKTTDICECKITPEDTEKAITENGSFDAVYVTSPDYLGNILDIRGIAAVCENHKIPLLVDNAHGAYLKFLKPSIHPMDCGAAMCADSAHKTLPVLTGGAYLHINKSYGNFAETAQKKLRLFASTSPSYLTLQSLDLCNIYLANKYSEKLYKTVCKIEHLKNIFKENGISVKQTEPLKITVNTYKSGYTGTEFAEFLRTYKIEPEFYDNSYLVLMLSPENTSRDLKRLKRAAENFKPKKPLCENLPDFPAPIAVTDIKTAVLSESETVCTTDSIGRICAEPSVNCPPAIPVIISGERITEQAINIMLYYEIENIEVIKGAE